MHPGGRKNPVFSGYQPQLFFRTAGVTATLSLAEGQDMAMPGDHAGIDVELLAPLPLEPQQTFAIREGGLTVGRGRVTEVLD